jgi:ABC-type Na+ efflux pump permease subunit
MWKAPLAAPLALLLLTAPGLPGAVEQDGGTLQSTPPGGDESSKGKERKEREGKGALPGLVTVERSSKETVTVVKGTPDKTTTEKSVTERTTTETKVGGAVKADGGDARPRGGGVTLVIVLTITLLLLVVALIANSAPGPAQLEEAVRKVLDPSIASSVRETLEKAIQEEVARTMGPAIDKALEEAAERARKHHK